MNISEIKKSLKKGIVSDNMLAEAAFSYNKRAKNYRDRQREYAEIRRTHKYWHDKYDNEDKAREKKEEYYSKKEEVLHYKNPVKIHVLTRYKWNGEALPPEYYLFYDFGGHSFHSPIPADRVEDYNLEVENLDDDFETFGEDITNLMSCQTADKIRLGLKNGVYQLG